jgi:hypothetical protein
MVKKPNKTRRKVAKRLTRRAPTRSAKPQLRRARRQHAKLAAGKKKIVKKSVSETVVPIMPQSSIEDDEDDDA